MGGFLVFAAALLFVLSNLTQQSETNANKIAKTREAQIQLVLFLRENCRVNGNPLRTGLREDAQIQKYEALHPSPAILKALHLTLTKAQIRDLNRDKIERLNYNINVRWKALDCDTLFDPQHLIPPK